MLEVGAVAPEFALQDQDGKTWTLHELRGQRVLVWFFPKASTPGCTAEGCNIQDHLPRFEDAGIQVLGVSKDSVKRQGSFAAKYGFEYPLLSDETGAMIEAYGAWGRKKFMGREFDGILRISYLIDGGGKIEKVFGKVKTKTHGEDVLASL